PRRLRPLPLVAGGPRHEVVAPLRAGHRSPARDSDQQDPQARAPRRALGVHRPRVVASPEGRPLPPADRRRRRRPPRGVRPPRTPGRPRRGLSLLRAIHVDTEHPLRDPPDPYLLRALGAAVAAVVAADVLVPLVARVPEHA